MGIDGASLVSGFALSLGLIIAIGPQNAFLLKQGIRRQHVLAVATTCFVSDLVLLSTGIFGSAALFSLHPALAAVMTWTGIVFITGYGLFNLRAAMRPDAMIVDDTTDGPGRSVGAAVGTVLLLTWANPHAYVDTQVMMGGISVQYPPGAARSSFWVGTVLASALWFYGVGLGARFLTPLLASPRSWRLLDLGIGVTMLVIAGSLALARLSGPA